MGIFLSKLRLSHRATGFHQVDHLWETEKRIGWQEFGLSQRYEIGTVHQSLCVCIVYLQNIIYTVYVENIKCCYVYLYIYTHRVVYM